jgi:hypothetical protein
VEQNDEAVKTTNKKPVMADMKCTEKTALNMEVETLRWQLAQVIKRKEKFAGF